MNDKEYELYNKEVSLMTIDKGSININGEKFSYVILIFNHFKRDFTPYNRSLSQYKRLF